MKENGRTIIFMDKENTRIYQLENNIMANLREESIMEQENS